MKRFLLSIVVLAFTSVCFAQDIIVKKDGSTIQSKVLEVSSTEVKYKLYQNEDGPTYIVNVTDLQAINYQNGRKELFNSAAINKQENTESINIHNSAYGQQTLNDADLLKAYKMYSGKHRSKGTKLIISGYVLGGAGLLAGLIGSPMTEDWIVFGLATGAGAIVSVPMLVRGYKLNKHQSPATKRIQSANIYQYSIPLSKKQSLSANIDVLNDTFSKQRTLGMGLSYNF